jgi:hypothetical protein
VTNKRHVVVEINKNFESDRECVVVLGVPRGGTSVVAGICQLLGFQMGIEIDPSNMESIEIQKLSKDISLRSEFKNIISSLSSKSLKFGFKDPTAIDWILRVHDLIPNPKYIYVSRDLAATTERERIASNPIRESLIAANNRTNQIVHFLLSQNYPSAMLSYERLLLHPKNGILELSEFLNVPMDPEVAGQMADLVRPSMDMPSEVNFLTSSISLRRTSQ